MLKVDLGSQLMIRVHNEVGTLAEITSLISSSGINMIAICAYSLEDMAALMFVTEDNNEARNLLETHGFQVQEEEVILLSVPNKPGSLRKVTDKLAEAGLNLALMYGSVDQKEKTSRIVMISESNLDAVLVIKMLIQRS